MVSEPTTTTLGDISEDVAYGYTESASEKEVGPRFLRITDIQNGVVNWSTVPFCPISESDHEKYRLHAGDIVVARTGNSTGENFLFRGGADSVFASYLIRFRVDQRRADPAYVWYNLRTKRWWNYVHGSKTGSAQAGANAKVLGKFELQLPPLPEQKAIARILGTLDNKIELNQRMNTTLEAMARALFQSWFVDFDPVHAKAAGHPPSGMDTPAAALFPAAFQDSDLGEIPEGWRVKTIGETIELAYGKPLKEQDRRGGSVAVFGSNGRVGWHDEKLVSGPGIVVGRKGNPGIVTWAHSDFYPIDTTFYVVPIAECRSLYFLYYALSIQNLANLGADSAVPGLNRNHAYMSKLVIPSSKALAVFDAQIAPLFSQIHANDRQSSTLGTLRDTLLPKLLSGELSTTAEAQSM